METEKTIEVPTTALAFKPDIAWWDIERVIPYERNPKKHSEAQVNRLAQTIARFGWDQPIVVDGAGVIIKGHCRREAALKLKINPVPVTVRTDMSPEDVKAARIADNAVAIAPWDDDLLDLEMRDLRLAEYDVSLTALDAKELAQLGFEEPPPPEVGPSSLADRFGVPPFSVLDARQGYWQDRKRGWLALGIKSELGRGGASPGGSPRPAAQLNANGRTMRGDGVGRAI